MNRRDRVSRGTLDVEVHDFKALLRNPNDEEKISMFVQSLRGQRGRGQAGTTGATGTAGSATTGGPPWHPFMMRAT